MDKEILFKIRTTMETADNRNYLYIRAFKQNSVFFVSVAIVSVFAGALFAVLFHKLNPIGLIQGWALAYLIMFAFRLFKLEVQHKKRLRSPEAIVFGNITDMTFYDNYMIMETNIAPDKSVLYYNKFYGLVETRGYYIFYYTNAAATLLRKKDMKDVDKEKFHKFITEKFANKYKKL